MIFIFGRTAEFKYFSDYVSSIQTKLNCRLFIFNDYNNAIEYLSSPYDHYIFLQMFPSNFNIEKYHNFKNIYLLNTEQVGECTWNNIVPTYLNLPIKFIEWSEGNVIIAKNKYHINPLCMPYQVNYAEIFNIPKIKDVAMIGTGSQRRTDIYNQLKNAGIKIDIISGWNKERDDELFKYKILVNVHCYSNSGILEDFRCNRCVFNNMIVITEKSLHFNKHLLQNYIIECDYGNIVDTVKSTLDNYSYVHKKLFQNFSLDKLNNEYTKYITNIFGDEGSFNCTAYFFSHPAYHDAVYDYIESILNYLNEKNIRCKLVLDYYLPKIKSYLISPNDYYIFVGQVPPEINPDNHKNLKLFLINTEQFNDTLWVRDVKPYIDNSSIKLLDYSLANITLTNKYYNKLVYYLPYQVNYSEIYNIEKTKSVALVGRFSDKRKQIVSDVSASGIIIDVVTGWKSERDSKLFQYKILLNIRGGNRPYNIFEEMRCNRCIFNKMIIITDKHSGLNDNPLRKYIIECEDSAIPSTLINVLKNYTKIHKKLFDDFDIQKIKKNYNKYISELFL